MVGRFHVPFTKPDAIDKRMPTPKVVTAVFMSVCDGCCTVMVSFNLKLPEGPVVASCLGEKNKHEAARARSVRDAVAGRAGRASGRQAGERAVWRASGR